MRTLVALFVAVHAMAGEAVVEREWLPPTQPQEGVSYPLTVPYCGGECWHRWVVYASLFSRNDFKILTYI